MLLEGIFLPLTTPFHPDGRLFLRKLETNVERYSKTGAAGMLVLGREGEGDSLTDAETREALKAAIGAAADEKVMVANVGRESVAATLELVDAAAEYGYDAVALRPPLGYRPQMDWEVMAFYNTIADRSPLPIIVAIDREHGMFWDAVGAIAGHPQIIGAIESAVPGSPENSPWPSTREPLHRLKHLLEETAGVTREVTVTGTFAAVTGRMRRHSAPDASFVSLEALGGGVAIAAPPASKLKTRTRRVGFQVLYGSTATMLSAWNAGATGAVPRLAACAPQACCEVWQAHKDGDPALAEEKQERVRLASAPFEGESGSAVPLLMRRGIAPLKYGCDLNAYFGGRPRLPLLPLDAEAREAVERALAGIQN